MKVLTTLLAAAAVALAGAGILLWSGIYNIENGIKMTGMPAFGPRHGARQLWNVVAFVQTLGDVTPPEAYGDLIRKRAPGGHAHD